MGFALSKMAITSTEFAQNGSIPARYTGEGEDFSPPLAWQNAPEGTKSFAVVCHDPDAPLIAPNGTYGFTHWVLYNVPASVSSLEEATGQFTAGKNDFGKSGYGGPMPPNGHGTHRYYFMVLALNDAPDLPAGLTITELLERIEPYVIGMNRLVGTYERA